MTDQVRASHILLMYDGSMRSTATRSKEAAEVQISDLKSELEGGAKFADVARENSDCPSSGQGGELGSFSRGMMVGAFEDTAFTLEVGSTSGVIETEFGYHIIHRTE